MTLNCSVTATDIYCFRAIFLERFLNDDDEVDFIVDDLQRFLNVDFGKSWMGMKVRISNMYSPEEYWDFDFAKRVVSSSLLEDGEIIEF